MFTKIKDWILERGSEKSTVLSVLTFGLGAVGLTLSPESQDAIAVAVVAVLTAVGIVTKEEK